MRRLYMQILVNIFLLTKEESLRRQNKCFFFFSKLYKRQVFIEIYLYIKSIIY